MQSSQSRRSASEAAVREDVALRESRESSFVELEEERGFCGDFFGFFFFFS